MTSENPSNPNDAIDRATRIIAQSLAQGLMEAEVIIAADRDSRAQMIPPQLADTLDRFSAVLTRLVDHTEQLAERMTELTEAVTALADTRQPAPAASPRLPELEPSFAPGGEGIDVTIASVPGFQGLMELQRGLVRLPQVQSAAVRRYQDDEASIQLVLSQPMTATAIAEGITTGTGYRIFVDESRPDSLRLKLRFLTDAN
ncbi:MAG: hypothetical protein WEC75_02805 [Dehalococcoidia bacterium]